MIKEGLYEQIINEEVLENLNELDKEKYIIDKEKLDNEEARAILAQYIESVIRKALNYVRDKAKEDNEKLLKQIEACNKIVYILSEVSNEDDIKKYKISENGEMLTALYSKINNKRAISKEKAIRPVTPISQSSLFTGATMEPNMLSELNKEILSCDSIDLLVSFVKWSGIRCLIESLEEAALNGKKIRIITTSYMGATDEKAIYELAKLPNIEIKISYDTERTRLHAKAYMFKRNTGFTTAYIGSSNISNVALTSGLEWNIKITEQDSFDIVKKFEATFESYWNDGEFVLFTGTDEDKLKLRMALRKENKEVERENNFLFDIKPYSYQKEILERLDAERKLFNKNKNLVIAATGVGKTVISAFDYKNYCKENKGQVNRLLFVVHREEILKQARDTFRAILKNNNFGELMVGGRTPENIDHLFVSIQSLNSKKLFEVTSEDYYDFIIVDEFHHAAAPSYQKLLSYYKPKILLGLTATPERNDEKEIFSYFEDRIGAEIRYGKSGDRSFARMSVMAGVKEDFNEENEVEITKKLRNLFHINSRRLIEFFNKIINEEIDIYNVNNEEKLMMNMMYYTFYNNCPEKENLNSLQEGLERLLKNKNMMAEVKEILKYNYHKLGFVDKRVELGFDCPMDLHCNYTRNQIMAALDYFNGEKKPAFREGVKCFADKKLDVFFITLNKSEKDFSPSTLYEDYAINEKLFHWQSQSTTSVESVTGKRYINHKKENSKIVLFVRENQKDNGITSSYTYLGLAEYKSHMGSKPISITWELQEEIPSWMINKANKSIII